MAVDLPLDTRLMPQYRFLRKRVWAGPWEILPSGVLGGFFLEECWREALPGVGQLVMRYDAGTFNDRLYGENQAQTAEIDDINLVGQFIRLQMAPGQEIGDTTAPAWATVWVGGVEYQQDSFSAPGSDSLLLSRKFFCLDLFAYFTKRQPLRRHSLYVADTGSPPGTNDAAHTTDNYYLDAVGDFSYNVRGPDGRILGNRSDKKYFDAPQDQRVDLTWKEGNSSLAGDGTFKSKLYCHTHMGLGSAWTDLQAVEHALASSAPAYGPYFYLNGATQLLSVPSLGWDIPLGTTAWDFAAKVCNRRRGRGLCFFDWSGDAGDTGELTYFVSVRAQNAADITYTIPSKASDPIPSHRTQTITGAINGSTSTTVTLTGDHRNISSTFALGDRFQHTYDQLETVSEKIQVLVNLDLNSGSLTKQWPLSEQTAFDAETSFARKLLYRYDIVYQLIGLNQAWDCTAGDGKATPTTKSRVDYRLNADATIISAGTGKYSDTPIDSIEVLHDLPLFSGYNYASATTGGVRYDTSPTEMVTPDRRPILLLYRTGTDQYSRAEDFLGGVTVSSQARRRFLITVGQDAGNGNRSFKTAFDMTKLVLVCALELPHRVGMKSSRAAASNVFRKQIITVPGLHVWVAPAQSIWDLDRTDTPTGTALKPLRSAGAPASGGVGLLRDDRDLLAFFHNLAASWYLNERRTATWQLRDCGLLPSYTDNTLGTVNYPTLGQVVTTLNAGGLDYTINTPITKIHYQHSSSSPSTTYITDWGDLDLA